MFTGIVRELGHVGAATGGPRGLRLEVEAPATAAATSIGDSVAVNGCCLTAVSIDGARIGFDAVAETLARTSLRNLSPGAAVNLEPALRVGDPLGGHFVQGHVDGVATVQRVEPEGDGRRIWVEAAPELTRYVVEKGSVTLEGVSLTVAQVDREAFAVALVPHTLAVTTLGGLAPGSAVNLEVDVLAKYVERLLARG